MEDVIQRVFAILISVIIFFLFPIYIAFEKKDDISYALALKITTNFVDNVTSKGYVTTKMYNDFISDLSVTNNTYDVKIEHRSKNYTPVLQKYTRRTDSSGNYVYERVANDEKDYFTNRTSIQDGGNLRFVEYTEEEIRTGKNKAGTDYFVGSDGYYYQVGYKENEEIYNWEQISNILENNAYYSLSASAYNSTSESNIKSYVILTDLIDSNLRADVSNKIYTMSEGDEFNVIIKNTNVTIASVLFNTLTMGANDGNDTKVYINYGGTVQNEDYLAE